MTEDYEQAIRAAEERADAFFRQTLDEREVQYRRDMEIRVRKIEDQVAELVALCSWMTPTVDPKNTRGIPGQ